MLYEVITISSGCHGGWSEFGSVRTITKSRDNVLFEIDGEPALDLYKRYLGVITSYSIHYTKLYDAPFRLDRDSDLLL